MATASTVTLSLTAQKSIRVEFTTTGARGAHDFAGVAMLLAPASLLEGAAFGSCPERFRHSGKTAKGGTRWPRGAWSGLATFFFCAS